MNRDFGRYRDIYITYISKFKGINPNSCRRSAMILCNIVVKYSARQIPQYRDVENATLFNDVGIPNETNKLPSKEPRSEYILKPWRVLCSQSKTSPGFLF